MTAIDHPSPPDRMPDPAVREHAATGVNGFLGLLVGLGLLAVGAVLAVTGSDSGSGGTVPAGVLVLLLGVLALRGLVTISPGRARVVQFFGRYVGAVRTAGLRWVNPFTRRTTISTRIRNHESEVLKVNDYDGNPIEIAAVGVWQVQDTARAVFEVDSFVAFVHTQTETAIRHIATSYPYDIHYLLRAALAEAGRLPRDATPSRPRGRRDPTSGRSRSGPRGGHGHRLLILRLHLQAEVQTATSTCHDAVIVKRRGPSPVPAP
jgi:hypothetical protein